MLAAEMEMVDQTRSEYRPASELTVQLRKHAVPALIVLIARDLAYVRTYQALNSVSVSSPLLLLINAVSTTWGFNSLLCRLIVTSALLILATE